MDIVQLPAVLDITIVQGDSFARDICLTLADGAPYVPSGADSVTFCLTAQGGADVVLEVTSLHLALTSQASAALPCGIHSYNIRVQRAAIVETVIAGKFTVTLR